MLVIGVEDAEPPGPARPRVLPPSAFTDHPLQADDQRRTWPGLARSWSASADRRTWRLTIPEQLVTHHGAWTLAAPDCDTQ